MTPALRKVHRYTWYTLAVLLPAAWLAAVLSIPDEIWQEPVRPQLPAPLPVIAYSRQSGDWLINIRRDSSGLRRQLEILIGKPLTEPNVSVYLRYNRPGSGPDTQASHNPDVFLGLLGARGIHRIDLPNPGQGREMHMLVFKDHIRGRIIKQAAFE